MYRLNGRSLKPIHDWVTTYERLWNERFEQLDVVLDELKERKEKQKTMATTASSGSAVVTLPGETQIHVTRDFNAPKDLVYRALTEPDLIRRWWNAKRGEVTVCDSRPARRRQLALPDGHARRHRGRVPRHVPRDRAERAPRLHRAVRDARHLGGRRDGQHRHPGGVRRPHDDDVRHRVPRRGGPRHDHRDRHGGRDAGRLRPARGARDLAPPDAISLRDRCRREPRSRRFVIRRGSLLASRRRGRRSCPASWRARRGSSSSATASAPPPPRSAGAAGARRAADARRSRSPRACA